MALNIQKKMFLIFVICALCEFQKGFTKIQKNKFLLMLFDGFRWNYLDRGDLPNFDRFQQSGVRAKYMEPTFPSLSYPGYYTIQTGLYVENHGFIDNNMYDPKHETIFYTDTSANGSKPFWWQEAEPFWITATKSGLRTYVYQWPGCHVHIFGTVPTYFEKYEYHNDTTVLKRNLADVLERFENNEADVGIIYSEYTDIIGHAYGPESEEMYVAIRNIDNVIGLLLDGLQEKSLKDEVNIILVSDHGMTQSDHSSVRRYRLDELTDLNDIELVLGFGAESGIIPVKGKLNKVYSDLQGTEGLNVWKKDEIPERLHYKNNDRVPPIFVLAEKGYFLEEIGNTTKQIPSVLGVPVKYYKGFHGYDPQGFPDMRALFLANGPDFMENLLGPEIRMTDVYNLMLTLTNLNGHQNNGTWDNVKGMLKNQDSGAMPDYNKDYKGISSSYLSTFFMFIYLIIINLSAILAMMDFPNFGFLEL